MASNGPAFLPGSFKTRYSTPNRILGCGGGQLRWGLLVGFIDQKAISKIIEDLANICFWHLWHLWRADQLFMEPVLSRRPDWTSLRISILGVYVRLSEDVILTSGCSNPSSLSLSRCATLVSICWMFYPHR
jgi:hypothetical protein